MKQKFGLIVDMGTTNVGLALIDLKKKARLETVFTPNLQKNHGLDVIARLTFFLTNPGHNLKILRQLAFESIIDGFKKFKKKPVPAAIKIIGVVGNSVMLHFFWGEPPEKLMQAPFHSPHLKKNTQSTGSQIGFDFFAKSQIFSPPVIAGFVGADCIANLFFLRKNKKPFFLLDLGTNAEISLVTSQKIFSTSAAAGPAFAGYLDEKKLYGSELIRLVVKLLENNGLNSPGNLKKENPELQKSIRILQMAKAAVRSGAEILLDRAKLRPKDIKNFYITGYFGKKIKARQFVRLGLIPEGINLTGIKIIPNLPLAGAKKILLNFKKAEKIIKKNILSRAVYINLAGAKKFNKLFMKHLEFNERSLK